MVNHISKTAFYPYKVVVGNGRSYAVCPCVCLSTGCNTSSLQHETPYSVFLSITIGDIDCIINPLIFQRLLPFFKKVSNCFRAHPQGKLQPFSMIFPTRRTRKIRIGRSLRFVRPQNLHAHFRQ